MRRALAWARSSGSGSGFLINKTQSPSPRVGLGPKDNFFIYVVKPEPKPELSPTYLVNFSSPKKPEPEVWSPSPTRAQKNQARSTSRTNTFAYFAASSMKRGKRYNNTNRIWSLSECSTRPITRTWPSSSKVGQNKKRISFISEAPEEARTVEFMKKLFKGEKVRKVGEYFFLPIRQIMAKLNNLTPYTRARNETRPLACTIKFLRS